MPAKKNKDGLIGGSFVSFAEHNKVKAKQRLEQRKKQEAKAKAEADA